MKKVLIIMVGIMMILAGCEQTAPAKTDGSFESSVIVSESSTEKDFVIDDLIPDPAGIFSTDEISHVKTKTMVNYEVTKYADSEYSAYVKACKDLDWSDVSFETDYDKGKDFGAYNSDKSYYIQVSMDKQKSVIYINCHKTNPTTTNESSASQK